MIVRVTVLTVPAADAELAADRLMQAGAFAVEERDVGDGRSSCGGSIAEALPVAIDRLGALPDGWSVRIDEVDATPADTWREYADRSRSPDDLVIRPAWLAPLDRARRDGGRDRAGCGVRARRPPDDPPVGGRGLALVSDGRRRARRRVRDRACSRSSALLAGASAAVGDRHRRAGGGRSRSTTPPATASASGSRCRRRRCGESTGPIDSWSPTSWRRRWSRSPTTCDGLTAQAAG